MHNIRAFEPLWGEWRTIRVLGQGSYGKVYLAEKVELGKHYYSAIKYIGIPNDENQTKELYSEGLVTDDATLNNYYEQVLHSLMAEISINYELKGNSNIVSYEEHKVIPRESEPGYDIFIKMELLTSLPDYISSQALTVADVVRLGCDMCTALTVLQQKKIIHRDIKPANIFIHSSGHFKLGDFGVARTMEKTVNSMSVKGTFAFMAPEVARGGEGDFRVDIYSLGLVLYRLLNGNRSPFLPPPPAVISYDDNNLAQRRRMQGEPLPAPAMADPSLAAIVLRACAYQPQDRYQDAKEMYEALQRYIAQLPPDQAAAVVFGKAAVQSPHTADGELSGPRTQAPSGRESAHLSPESGDEETVFLPQENAGEETVFLPQESTGEETVFLPQENMGEETVFLPQESAGEETVFLPQEGTGEETVFLPQEGAGEETVFLPQEDAEEATVFLPQEDAAGHGGAAAQAGRMQQETHVPSGQPLDRGMSHKSKLPLFLGVGGAAAVAIVAGILLMGQQAREEGAQDLATPVTTVSAAIQSAMPTPVSTSTLQFPDSGLAAAIRAELDLSPEAPLEMAQLGEITELRLGTQTGIIVSDLSGLEYLSNLSILDISGQSVNNLSMLAELPELISLNLGNCQIMDVGVLEQLPASMENLDLRNTGLTSVAFADRLTHLRYLNISGNQITDLSPLSQLTQLSNLEASGNPVEDWTVVSQVATVSGVPAESTAPTPTPTAAQSTPQASAKATPQATPKPKHTPKPTPKPTPAPTPKPTSSTVSVTGVSISRGSIVLDVGGGASLSATVSPSNATNESISWSSSNPAVATVTSSGYVTAVGPGTAVITASCGGYSARCTVSVS